MGCSHAGSRPERVLRLASADPAGVEHAPAVAFFVDRVAKLSGGRLRIVVDERWAPGHETTLLRDVARGTTDLGWAHTRNFEPMGVRSFVPFDAPMLIDGYRVERAVLSSPLAARMLAGTRSAGLRGLALLSGPLSRLVGVGGPLRGLADLRHLGIGLHDLVYANGKHLHSAALYTTSALHAFPGPMYPGILQENYLGTRGARFAFEDDLDSVFFDRYAGDCRPDCTASDPSVSANVVLWPRPAVLVANPRTFAALGVRERSWIESAASQAARYSETIGHDAEQRLVRELCAAGVRFSAMTPASVMSMRRALRKAYARLERSPPTRRAIRWIRSLRRAVPADPALLVPAACRRPAPPVTRARGGPSSVPDGVYRARITTADLRAARATAAGDRPGTATLTLRNGRWRLELREPGRTVRRGTYAGPALWTTWTYDGAQPSTSYVSIVVGRDASLRFHVVTAYDMSSARATFASHPFERIDR
jgi:TRAP-type C4-dicarboxylate transport system substrate-binding protein